MRSSSPRRDVETTEDVFDDEPNGHLNHSSSDIKLRRSHAEPSTHPVIHRALSTVSANQTLVHNQRNVLARNFRRISVNDEIVTIDHTDADASFLLPNLYELPDEIRTRAMDSLVDTPTMTTLEETKRLNWWANKKLPCPKLYPLLTSGDGNCLLHATSLAMWGFHDHSLSMRKALNETLITSKPNNSLYRRWRWAQCVQNKKYGLVFSEQEWSEEWKGLLRLSSIEPRVSQISAGRNSSDANSSTNEGTRHKSPQSVTAIHTGGSTKSSSQSTRQYYESLEEFHVYVLANNIRRPIIIYSDTVLRTNDGEAISPIEFGGIYLPLEIPPEKCHKQPVFLAFDAAHFSALVPMEQNSKSNTKATYRIPLIDIDAIDLLPIHYFVDPGPDFAWPMDEELSDEKIHLYTHYGESRMETLEKYLNLSQEVCPLSTVLPSPATTTTTTPNIADEASSITDRNPSSISNADASSLLTESSSTATPAASRKLSRPSFNSFSKIIRRTFIEPFSSGKRASLKQQRQQAHTDTSDTSVIAENEHVRRASSPLLNRHTNSLTIIVTNFQPKRPKTSDNMIKNYIDTCMSEYRLEKSHEQPNEASSANENDTKDTHSDRNTESSSHPQGSLYRRYPSTSSTSRYAANSHDKPSDNPVRRLPSVPTQSANKLSTGTKRPPKNCDMDDSDDFLPAESGQFSSHINYVQPTQKKISTLPQSNSLEMSQQRHQHSDHVTNGTSVHRTNNTAHGQDERSKHPAITAVLPSTFQPNALKRQQSLGHDRAMTIQRVPDPTANSHRSSVKIPAIPSTKRLPYVDQQKRF